MRLARIIEIEPPVHRRAFLTTAGLLTAGTLAASCRTDEERSRTASAGPPSAEDAAWQEVRDQFHLAPAFIHLSALLVSTHPRPVRDAIDRYRRALDENPVTYLQEHNDALKHDVRVAAAEYLGGGPNHVALTDSTTMGIALVYHGLPLRPGQEVLTTEHDYYATHEALRQVSDRTGASVRQVALYDRPQDASEDEIAGRIAGAITPATRVLALTWVHSGTGLKLPMQAINEVVAEANRGRSDEDRLLVALDGVHGFGVEDARADDLGCDFFMAGCHKWLFGPRGTGIVWARPEAWARLRPIIPSFMDDASWNAWARAADPSGPTTAARMSPGGFKPFEHQWAMADAFRFHQEIGRRRIAERTHALARQLKEGLAGMPHVTVYTPQASELSAGIVCFDVEGRSPEAVVDRLAQRKIIASATPYAASYPRLTPSIYNTSAEVDAALQAIHELA